MGRILSIDLGKKRTGLAWTDPLQLSINPLPTVTTEVLDDELKERLGSQEVTDVVFGLPSHADGSLTEVGQSVVKRMEQLRTAYSNITFHMIDEAFTSRRASQMMVHLGTKKKKRRQKESVDQMSAVLILKDFMDRI